MHFLISALGMAHLPDLTPTPEQPQLSRLDLLEAEIEDADKSVRQWMSHSDRTTVRDLIQLARQARGTFDRKYDLTDEHDVRRLLDNWIELAQMLTDLTDGKRDDRIVAIASNVVGQPHFVACITNGVGLYQDLREAYGK